MSKQVISASISVGVATGLYGISFGALASVAGIDLLSIMLLSILMFSGASQFAFIGVIAAGGAPVAAITSAWLLGVRNSFYALRLTTIIQPKGLWRLLAAQFSIDESNAVSSAQVELKDQKLGFWLTGAAVFVFWNLATFFGAVVGELFGSAEAWGLDAAAAAAFLGLLWPRLKKQWPLALIAAALATFLTPWLPAGSAILAAVLVALLPIGAKK